MRDYLQAVRDHVVIFDGGLGASLEQLDLDLERDYGLPGRCHEVLVLNRPDVIEGVHAGMLDAGAEVIETDTFQASRLKLGEWGIGERALEINVKAAQIARRAAGPDRFVAGSIGPTGFLPGSGDPMLGRIGFRELVDVYTEQARGLVRGGADLLMIETVQDILEAKAAVFGAREAFKLEGRTLPIEVSVTLLQNGGRMLLGTPIDAVLTTLQALNVDAVGLNCSTGPDDMRDPIRYLAENATVPVHCIPNAGIPHQGPHGETVYPEQPGPLADTVGDYVDRYGVGIVGGCCGTTPAHIAALVERVRAHGAAGARPAGRAPHISSMIADTALVQEPRPTIVGERINAQGSRKAKELLLAEDYDALTEIAENQVEGGAHVLDVCVALTERQDEAEQMREVVGRISLSVPTPLQIDSTDPDVIEAALERLPGRSIINSVNLEAGRAKLDRVAPLAKAHGAALIALTIDEDGMATTVERKLAIAERLRTLCCDEHGLDPETLIIDPLTFTLATGEAQWRHSAVETIEGIRTIKERIPGVKTSLGVSNVSFGVSPRARAVINSVFLHHCVKAGLDLAMVNPHQITPYAEIPEHERELADDLVLDRRADALERLIGYFESRSGEADAGPEGAGDPTDGMEPEEALHFMILRRRRDGIDDWVDKAARKLGAVPTLNEVLLPAMKEVGDKFGAGELILPFVLQSAEVMKRAVARLERYLDRIDSYTKGTVVLATVFGDVHDIGKSLVNTILTNNGYTVVDLGKQVPVQTIIDAAIEHQATAIGLSALLVSTSRQMPAAIAELHARKLDFPVLLGGAAINRNFGLRALFAEGDDSDAVYEPGVFFCKDAFEGLATMERITDSDQRQELVRKTVAAAQALRQTQLETPAAPAPATSATGVRSAARIDVPVPTPPYWGARELDVDRDEVLANLDTHVLFKLHWGGHGVKGDAWERLIHDDFEPRLARMWRDATYLQLRSLVGYFPCNADGNDLIIWDPASLETGSPRELERLVFPRQPGHDRICLADFFRPLANGGSGGGGAPATTTGKRAALGDDAGRAAGADDGSAFDVVALQAVTAGPEVTALTARLEAEGEFAEQLFVHGLGVQAAEALAEWTHAQVRSALGIPATQGRRYSWGYPACPDQSEHTKVFRLLAPESIGLRLSGGFAIEPEQSTLAIVAHHPQAVYFGMRSGTLPKTARQAADEIIAGSEKAPSLAPER
jgi:5-methyltetrahydrofolate--homocysteine methyltransferase